MSSPATIILDLQAADVAEGEIVDARETIQPFIFYSPSLDDIVPIPGGFFHDGESAGILKKRGSTRRSGGGHDWPYKMHGYWQITLEMARDYLDEKWTRWLVDKGSRGQWVSGQFIELNREQADMIYLELALSKESNCPPWIAHTRHAGLRLLGGFAWAKHGRNLEANRSLTNNNLESL